MKTLYKIDTSDADELKEKYFIVDEYNIVIFESYEKLSYSSLGRNWDTVYMNYASVWKLYSSLLKDNVYPNITKLSELM